MKARLAPLDQAERPDAVGALNQRQSNNDV